jgi:hypothetical protein
MKKDREHNEEGQRTQWQKEKDQTTIYTTLHKNTTSSNTRLPGVNAGAPVG